MWTFHSAIDNGGGFATLSGPTNTNLALILGQKPPLNKPHGLRWWGWFLLVWLGTSLFVAFNLNTSKFVVSKASLNSLLTSNIIFLLAYITFMILLHRVLLNNDRQRYKRDELWLSDYNKIWATLYYCHRDNIVFDPNEIDYCAANDIMEFISKKIRRNRMKHHNE